MSESDQQFPAQQQQPPGLTEPMMPAPDHVESSLQGSGIGVTGGKPVF
jgi:hypothetical protein